MSAQPNRFLELYPTTLKHMDAPTFGRRTELTPWALEGNQFEQVWGRLEISGLSGDTTPRIELGELGPSTGLVSEVPDFRLVEQYRPRSTPMPRSELLAEWHGFVKSVSEGSFVAELRGVFGADISEVEEEAVIPFEEVRDDDMPLVRPGALFRLSISYERSIVGTVRRFTEVIFRRLPSYRGVDLDAAQREAAELLGDIAVE